MITLLDLKIASISMNVADGTGLTQQSESSMKTSDFFCGMT
jgi:hypothetical protein